MKLIEQVTNLSIETFPQINVKDFLQKINGIASEINLNITNYAKKPKDNIREINSFLFGKLGLKATEQKDMIFPNQVLETRKGTCVGLSLIYLLIGEELGLPLFGVLAPNHFFVKYEEDHYSRTIEPTREGSSIVPIENAICTSFYRKLTKEETIANLLVSRATNIYSVQGMFDLAKSDLDYAIELFPKHPYAYFNKGLIYFKQKKFPEALVEFEKSIGIYPDIYLDFIHQVQQKP